MFCSLSQAPSSSSVMTGSEALWSVKRGARRGTSARPSLTSWSKRRLSSVGLGKGIGHARHDDLQLRIAGGDELVRQNRHRLAIDRLLHHELKEAHRIDAVDILDQRGDVGEIDALAEIPASSIMAAGERMQERVEPR